MKIYIIGKNGQLGFDLDRVLSKKYEVDGGGREKFDVRRVDDFLAFIKFKYDIIINCSAYLDVVNSEKYIKDSFLMNAILPSVISKYCYENKIKFFHFMKSTEINYQVMIAKHSTSVGKHYIIVTCMQYFFNNKFHRLRG